MEFNIKGIARLTRGTHYNYTVGGHRLIKSVPRPSFAEAAALRSGEAAFGLYVEAGVLFLMCRIGSGSWTASHYNWWLNPPGMRPDPLAELGAGDTGITLPLELVDACDGSVAAARAFFISTEPAAILRKCVVDQIESVLDPWNHLDTAGRVLGRSADLSWMAAEALWTECGRPAQSCQCSWGAFSCAGCT